ncbi:MFS transporter small subunit [Hymenobacter swuensis]|uniref:Oxalate:formate antiporter n=1 Tax=Hymenobacter swuensis DY53 TaxID=1227739 RepID=W8FAH8_9BACT|nr:hypothetical protein [Hymenobacter swuensis]AHJ99641.1 hypothetical protein Hsw_4046 [Hymenobacter swuensis DY53]
MSTPVNSSAPHVEEPVVGSSAIIAWLYVGLPLAWGVSQTFIKALALFK